MHTWRKLESEGPVCKCMDCARERHNRRIALKDPLRREALRQELVNKSTDELELLQEVANAILDDRGLTIGGHFDG